MNTLLVLLHISLLPTGLLLAQSDQPPSFTASQLQFFETQIRPLLVEHCYQCHSGDRLKGGLSLESRHALLQGGDSGAAIVPGDPAASLLVQAVRYDGLEMPPTARLPDTKVALLEQWIQQNAPWPAKSARSPGQPAKSLQVTDTDRRHWSFQPPRTVLTPPQSHLQHPIDALVMAGLQQAGLQPLPQAAPEILVRRAFLTLTGLPPTLAELRHWTQQISSPTPDALNEAGFASLLDDLLARPAYAEHWARHWLDVVRFGQTNGYERDGYKPYSWRYRDYVVQAMLQDKPWNRFLVEQLAGDELPDSTGESRAATGFYRVGVWDDEADDKRQAEFDDLDDVLVTVGASMLGLTIGCARCHDHKFDPLPQEDYYRMLSFFRGIRRYENPEDKPDSATALPLQDTAVVRRALTPQSGQTPPELTWTLAVREAAVQPAETRILVRGQAANPAAVVQPGFPQVLSGSATATADSLLLHEMHSQSPLADLFPSSGRRLAFARWLVRDDHPLTARVAVNRAWHFHFGQGLVSTTADFGRAGEAPVLQPLLDWLAVDFVRQGWSLKQLHRRILTSSAWRRSSQTTSGHAASVQRAEQQDPAARLLWRFPFRRLEAESIRDRMLFSSGELNSAVGGQEMYPQLSGEVLAGQSKPGLGWQTSSATEQARRSLYAIVKRGVRDPVLEALDYTNTATPLTERPVTTVSPQALILLHSRFTAERAMALARRARAAGDLTAQIQLIYEQILQRPPTAHELQTAEKLVTEWEQQLPLEREQVSFRPDVPESLYGLYRQQLPPDAFLLGPREMWQYRSGVWGGGYEGIDVVDKRSGPHAFWTGGQLANGTLSGMLRLDGSVETATLLAQGAPAGAGWSGLALTFDQQSGSIRLRFHPTGDAEQILAAVPWNRGNREWIPFRWEIGTEIRVFTENNKNPLLSVPISAEKLRSGRLGVAVWGGRLDLRDVEWCDAQASATPFALLARRSRQQEVAAPPGWSHYGGDWQRVSETHWRVAADRGGKIVRDQQTLTTGEVTVEMRMPAGKAEIGGLLLCVSEPKIGADNWFGYEVSLNIPARSVLVGDHRNNFRLLSQQAADVAVDRWHHLRAVLGTDRLQVFLDHQSQPVVDQALPDRLQGGLVGLRTWGSEIEFRNLQVQATGQPPTEPVVWPQHAVELLPETDAAEERRQQGLAALCRTMFSLSEFAYLE